MFITDDDLCSECQRCVYSPGEQSDCMKFFPGTKDEDGYIISCRPFVPVRLKGENWHPHAIWDVLKDTPVDDDGLLQEPLLELFPVGTDREFIWHWFERAFGIPVHSLMFPGERDLDHERYLAGFGPDEWVCRP